MEPLFIFLFCSLIWLSSGSPPPHIVLVLADDLGWNSVSWHNPDIQTPHMEELSRQGVRLEQSYVHTKCSPSRAALMTGIYPYKLGRQRSAIGRFAPTGLNTSHTILPQYLKKAGYKTHLVGKWHLGYCHPDYLPNNRGFDSFFGQWNHKTDYYTRQATDEDKPHRNGYDFHEDEEVTKEGEGKFSTELFTQKAVEVITKHDQNEPLFLYVAYQAPHAPFQAPPEKYTNLYKGTPLYQSKHIRKYGTISALDDGVGKIMDSLRASGMYNNTVFVFSTDNGGAFPDSSNLPLRGCKESNYEGGVRGVGFVHSPLLKKPGSVNNELMYITDWFSTFIHLAGRGNNVPESVDSFNMWSVISQGTKSPRTEIVLNVDQDNFLGTWNAAIRSGKWKLVWGQDRLLAQDDYQLSCRTQLFNLNSDPGETDNKADFRRNGTPRAQRMTVKWLKDRIMEEFRLMAPADDPNTNDRKGWPSNFEGNFATGWCQPRI